MMTSFTIYPAIDLRHGSVVRLQEGDPTRQKTYSVDPQKVADHWLQHGAKWLHVINLDGAFGEASSVNMQALESILETISRYDAHIQFGGGLRTDEAVAKALEMGIDRVLLGTLVIEQPASLAGLINRFGADRIAVSLDGRDGLVLTRGWQKPVNRTVLDTALAFKQSGLRWLIYTDVQHDGMQNGLNIQSSLELANATQLNIIASGGVRGWDDIHAARDAGFAGVIVGKALYEGVFEPGDLFKISAL